MTKKIDYIIVALIVIEANFDISYSLVSPYISWTDTEWLGALTIFLLGLWFFVYKYRLMVISQGEVTQEGIRLVKLNKIVPFHDIEKIDYVGEKSVAYIHTTGKTILARLGAQEILKLPGFGLNKWSISKKDVTISKELGTERFSASYSPMGKYADNKFLSNTLFVVCWVIIFLVYSDTAPEYIIAGFLIILLLFGIDQCKKVVATMDRGGIKLRDENLIEHCMSFDEVEKMEKGLFRTKVSAKDGRVIYFPQALFLWTELIEKYARLREK